MIFSYLLNMQSHPSWVCGLKRECCHARRETAYVTPFVGVWIETRNLVVQVSSLLSHPSWVCGLKLILTSFTLVWLSHTLRGCVD